MIIGIITQLHRTRITTMFWVYILRCNDQSYYTGHTDDLNIRIKQHENNAIESCYTSTRLPVQLVFWQPFATREEALFAEQRIKGWSRAKKEALINKNWDEIKILAKRKKAAHASRRRCAPPQRERF